MLPSMIRLALLRCPGAEGQHRRPVVVPHAQRVGDADLQGPSCTLTHTCPTSIIATTTDHAQNQHS